MPTEEQLDSSHFMNQWQAYLLTLVCEMPVMWLLARALPVRRVLLAAAAASTVTHPIAWRIASVLSSDEYTVGMVLIEIGVVLVEAVCYLIWLRPGLGKSLSWSLIANTTSFSVGYLVFSI